jgi:hypothetical protein
LNNYRLKSTESMTDQFENLNSLIDSFKISSLCSFLDSKSTSLNLCFAFQKIRERSNLIENSQLMKFNFQKMSNINRLFNEYHLKKKDQFLATIHNLIYHKNQKTEVIVQEKKIDLDEIENLKQEELKKLKEKMKIDTGLRQILFTNKAKQRLALISLFSTLNNRTDLSKEKNLIISKICFHYKLKTLDSFQVLRYPTIARHERQKSSQKLTELLLKNIHRNYQIFINKIIKKCGRQPQRMSSLFEKLFTRENKLKQIGFYSLMKSPHNNAAQLFVVKKLVNKMSEKKESSDEVLKKLALIKLMSLYFEKLKNGRNISEEVYMFDLYLEKRINFENFNNPLIFKKLNLKNFNLKLKREFENKRIENKIYQDNIDRYVESTRNLSFKKEKELKDLLERKKLNFCYESELKKVTAELFGNQKLNKTDHLSLSNMNETNDHHIKQNLNNENSFSKPLEVDEFVNCNSLNQNKTRSQKEKIKSEKRNVLLSKTYVDFLSNKLEKQKVFLKVRDLINEGEIDAETSFLEESVNSIMHSKSSIEEAVEQLSSFVNEMQKISNEKIRKLEVWENKKEQMKQSNLKNELILIDLQDNKGLMNLEKSKLMKRNEEIKDEVEELQLSISSFNGRTSLDSLEGTKLENLKSKYFTKQQIIQENQQKILKIDQDMIENSKHIGNLCEKINAIKSQKNQLGINDQKLVAENQELKDQIQEFKNEIHNALNQITMNSNLIEIFEKTRKKINESSFLESLSDEKAKLFTENFIKVNELKITRLNFLIEKAKKKLEYICKMEQIDSVSDKLEENLQFSCSKEDMNSHQNLNSQKKSLMAQLEKISQEMANVEALKKDIEDKIENTQDNLNQCLPEFEELDRKFSENSQNEGNLDYLSKNTFAMSTKMDLNHVETIENSTVKENVLSLSKSNLLEDNVRTILFSKMNNDLRDKLCTIDQNNSTTVSFDDVLNYLILKKKIYLQNNQLSFFNFLKKTEIEDQIKSNSCLILDLKEKIKENSIELNTINASIMKNNQKLYRMNSELKSSRENTLTNNHLSPLNHLNKNVQTEIQNTLFNLGFKTDKLDVIVAKQKINSDIFNTLIDTAIIPSKVKCFSIQKLSVYSQKKKVESLKGYKPFSDIEKDDIFESGTQNVVDDQILELDLKDSIKDNSFNLEEYFPNDLQVKTSKKNLVSRRPINVPNLQFGAHSYENIFNTVRVDKTIESLVKPLIKQNEISLIPHMIKVNSNAQFAKSNNAQRLLKLTDQAMKKNANLNFYQIKLATSMTNLQRLMNALNKFRLNNKQSHLLKLQNEMNNEKVFGLFELLLRLLNRRKQKGFDRIKNVYEALRKRRNLLLTKWMAVGDSSLRKQLKVVVQYWKHVSKDNMWNGNILKQMVLKSEANHGLVALWKLMLYKKRDYTCKPRVVKGLLVLLNAVDFKLLKKGFNQICKIEKPKNEFEAPSGMERKRSSGQLTMNSEVIQCRDFDDLDFGGKPKQLYYLFSYFSVLNKRLLMKSFFRFLNLVKSYPVKNRLIHFEFKQGAGDSNEDPKDQVTKFLLNQQLKSRTIIDEKESIIQNLQQELSEKDSHLYFMKTYLLNHSLHRIERIMRRILKDNHEKSKWTLMKTLCK